MPPKPRFVFQRPAATQALETKTITTLLQDRTGFLWAGTQDGLYRFEGSRTRRYGPDQGLPGRYIRQIGEAPDGTLWVATAAGIARLREDRFVPLTLRGASFRNTNQIFAFDTTGRMHLGTSRGLATLSSLGSGTVRLWHGASPEPRLFEAVTTGADGTVWFAAGHRVFRLVGAGRDERAEEIVAALPDEEIKSLLVDRSGALWVRTLTHFLTLRKGSASFVADDDGLPGANDFGGPSFDRSGGMMLPTVLGLFRRSGSGWEGIGRERGLSSNAVTAATEDREGALWIGYGGAGLERWPGRGTWSGWSSKEGLPDDVAWAVLRDARDRIWVGTNDGLAMWDPSGSSWKIWKERDGLAGRTIRQLIESPRGAVIALSVPGGLTRIDPDRLVAERIRFPGDASNEVPISLGSNEKRLLVSTRESLYSATEEGSLLSLERVPVPFDGGGVTARRTSVRDGVLWCAGRLGLARHDGKSWRVFTEKDGLRENDLAQVAPVSKDEAWVSYRGAPGISRLSIRDGAAHVEHLTMANGLSTDNPYFLGIDSSGHLWVGGDSGVSVVTAESGARSIKTYNQSDGVLWNDCSADGFWAERDGSVLFGTSRGLVRYAPSTSGSSDAGEVPPAIVLTAAQLGGESRLFGSKPAVPWSQRLFTAQFAGLTFRRPEDVRFRYRLVGLESEGETTETDLHEVRYAGLAAGSYRFEVSCRSASGLVSAAPATFAFTILPPWWQRLAVRLAFLGLLGLLGAALYRARVAHLVRARRTLEGLVVDRTRLLDERNRELNTTVNKLSDAQRQIFELQERSLTSLDDLQAFTSKVSREIADRVGIEELEVFTIEAGRISNVNPASDKTPPSCDEVEGASGVPVEREGDPGPSTLVPLLGPTGQLRGAIRVPALISRWSELDRQLLDTFVRHLGTTLELRTMRTRIIESQQERAHSLQELQDKGIDTLQVCPRCGRCTDQRAERCPVDREPLTATRILPLRIAGRYRLVRLLGEGGMGAVFKAEDEKLGRSVAAKIIRAEHLNDATVRARFEREARTVARIQHPGVVALYDSGELLDGSAFLVMELLQGRDLADVLEQHGPGNPVQVALVLGQVGDALEAAHAAGVVHRDLKPANIVLITSASGFQAKVVDFGLAKTTNENVKATKTGWVVGSPAYMSPEQVREEPLDGRSDLFSLASVTFELLTGESPFDAASIAEIFTKVLQKEPPPISSAVSGAPAEADRLFREAFEKKRDARPASIAAWSRRTARILASMPSARPGWPIAIVDASSSELPRVRPPIL
ncbi:MAG: protein kinase [Thermoanaerobaculia bacterium]